jgi:microcystin-dependent protein
MSNYTLTPNMDLPNPNPGIDPGPDYADNIYACFVLVDQHNHSPGYGELIQPNGLNISSDLTFNDNNATNLRSVRFQPQSAPLSLVTDIGCLYESGVDLWYNDGNGTQIQITASGSVNATTSALMNGLNRASFIANQLVVYSDYLNSTPANIVAGSILLGNNLPSSNYLTLQPPNAMPAGYTLTLPTIPSTNTELLQIDTSGNISHSGIQPNATNPAGAIIMYGGTAAPSGYLICDGTSYLRTAQPSLFAAIGTAYGAADGTHFNVPDFRGLFPRGVDNGAGNDPDTLTRTAANPGGNTGDNVGSYEADQFAAHNHSITTAFNSNAADGWATSANGTGGLHTMTTLNAGGSETRPKNLYVNFIIKT